ncbi:MAG TPA: hypothetical protein VK910_12945 [Thiobacillus sp.]|nr:hypothetical protein [Thiobacillus sp.]
MSVKTDFGQMEGWRFASGDEVGLFSDAFGALKITVPSRPLMA